MFRSCLRLCNKNLVTNTRRQFQAMMLLPPKTKTVFGRSSTAAPTTLMQQFRQVQQQKREAAANLPALRLLWKNLFGKYLLLTNVLSSGLLMVIGDLLAQEIEFRRGIHGLKQHYDMHRLWRMFVVGALQGPLHHYAYKWMDILMPAANARNAISKIFIDQLVMSPACILIFFYSACYLEGKCLQETHEELIAKFPYIYLMDWLLWPGAQYVNFRYVESKYRVMFVNICTALYDIFLSYMKHDDHISI